MNNSGLDKALWSGKAFGEPLSDDDREMLGTMGQPQTTLQGLSSYSPGIGRKAEDSKARKG